MRSHTLDKCIRFAKGRAAEYFKYGNGLASSGSHSIGDRDCIRAAAIRRYSVGAINRWRKGEDSGKQKAATLTTDNGILIISINSFFIVFRCAANLQRLLRILLSFHI